VKKQDRVKKTDRPSLRVVVKYGLLQLPGQAAFVLIFLLLRQVLEMPATMMWGLFALWVGKDVVLFFFLWRFYDPDQQSDRYRMVGRKGVALTRLNPDGYVRVRAERWLAGLAEESPPVEQGETVRVVAADGLKLTVRSCAE
jgi:membrane protein implicated in regulation of membrane protease activity